MNDTADVFPPAQVVSRGSPDGADGCPTDQPPEIRTKALGVRYGSHWALRDVSFSAAAGRITAIIGPSGCGKSSFLMCLNRLIEMVEGAHVTGRVYVAGRDIRAPEVDPNALRRHVGMIFQKPNPFPMSIRRNLELALRDQGLRNRQALANIISRVLMDVGLWDSVRDRLDRPATTLSGGQQQRLCLARALALNPRVLLLDEPCSALDPPATDQVEALLRRLRGRLTIVIVTHNLAQARRLADDVAVFWNDQGTGRLIEYGPSHQVFERPSHPITRAYVAGRTG